MKIKLCTTFRRKKTKFNFHTKSYKNGVFFFHILYSSLIKRSSTPSSTEFDIIFVKRNFILTFSNTFLEKTKLLIVLFRVKILAPLNFCTSFTLNCNKIQRTCGYIRKLYFKSGKIKQRVAHFTTKFYHSYNSAQYLY